MPAFFEFGILFSIGSLAYGLLEILFRGFTHWSMLIAGGVCFVLMYPICTGFRTAKWKKWIMCGAVITAVEFVAGGIVNILLGWNVWDYSAHRFDLMGQICLMFSALWTLLSIPAAELCIILQRKVFSRRPFLKGKPRQT